MRSCRHCGHQNADHLGYCSQCGKRLGPMTAVPLLPRAPTPRPHPAAENGSTAAAMTAATSPTMMSLSPAAQAKISTARVVREDSAAVKTGRTIWSVLSWIGDSIGYIYIYLRGQADAGERRRRLVNERDGSHRLLAGAIKELGTAILHEGIHAPDLTGLLEAIGRAEARREAALADIAAAERLQAAEDARLGAQETGLESQWRACDAARVEADEMLRPVTVESQEVAARLGRVRERRAAHERDAEMAAATPDGAARAAHLRHEASALASELAALQGQATRLEKELVELRDRSASLRAAAAAARSKLDAAVTARRGAAGAMGAAIVGHNRDRSEAEHETAELTEQLGRAAAQSRPLGQPLRPLYQRIDRLKETIEERSKAIAALDQSLAHYDQRKLLTGMGLLAGFVVVAVGVLWVVLK